MLRMPSLLDQGVIFCTCGHFLVDSESSQHYHQWRLDALSIQHYVVRMGRIRSARHSKTEAQKEHFVAHNVRKRCINIIVMEFTIVSNEIQYIVIHNSKLAGPRRSASQWINWHRKTTPTAHPLRSMRGIRKTRFISLNKSGRNAPMKLRSEFRTAVTIMNRLHRESGEERPEPIPFHRYQRWHSSSSSSPSWWQWNENWWSSEFVFYLL